MKKISLTCNQTIILLDCYRGYSRKRHEMFGNHGTDLDILQRAGLIVSGDEFGWALTNHGRMLAKHLLKEATWSMQFTPGSINE